MLIFVGAVGTLNSSSGRWGRFEERKCGGGVERRKENKKNLSVLPSGTMPFKRFLRARNFGSSCLSSSIFAPCEGFPAGLV